MDWSQHAIPPMRLEPRFGDRIVPAFCERPKSIPAMVADAVAVNPDGEALVCGDRRMTWRELAQQSAQIAAGFAKFGLKRGDRVAVLLGNRTEFVLTMLGAAHAGLVTVLLSTRQQRRRWPTVCPTRATFRMWRTGFRSMTIQNSRAFPNSPITLRSQRRSRSAKKTPP
jgi:non-ribosomal peptide synthetase component F